MWLNLRRKWLTQKWHVPHAPRVMAIAQHHPRPDWGPGQTCHGPTAWYTLALGPYALIFNVMWAWLSMLRWYADARLRMRISDWRLQREREREREPESEPKREHNIEHEVEYEHERERQLSASVQNYGSRVSTQFDRTKLQKPSVYGSREWPYSSRSLACSCSRSYLCSHSCFVFAFPFTLTRTTRYARFARIINNHYMHLYLIVRHHTRFCRAACGHQ